MATDLLTQLHAAFQQSWPNLAALLLEGINSLMTRIQYFFSAPLPQLLIHLRKRCFVVCSVVLTLNSAK
ncbi:hypothetical protein EPUL_005952 [Erysiphe pulchra]|uniref:Uncharacterized protein n=1 Tax=Erysiphe pulchra TaxID=225359 RepID=A0A2S4PIT3_9PEZI|nr:hypothetical protein EPUL_005952 [Erysiphe pulchra]